ncbi:MULTISPECIES: hypothetical protein [Acutalibacteraceae]|mgnify:CR=1 FL=1|uniref:hypothetical protein n=1 Tax=Acutalibacteraceae TaxID=3082771 RepID=UPI001FA9F2D9|nr:MULTISPECIES: hypothetical protein [Acutalibacteraceae]
MNWKEKLSSRKFWVAVAGLVVGVIALFSPGTDTSQVTGVIMALGSVVAYIVGEGMIDAAAAGTAQDPAENSGGQAGDSTGKTNPQG